jgi:hypothetical protein
LTAGVARSPFSGQVKSPRQAGDVGMPGEIEVLVYSGRPNPRAELDLLTEAELAKRLAELKPSEHAFAPADGLGYRGLHVVSRSAAREVEISPGVLRVHDLHGRTRDLADPARGVERWLLGVLAQRLPASDRPLIEEIVRQLDSSRPNAPDKRQA